MDAVLFEQKIQAAFAAHQAGDLVAAEGVYRELIALDPLNFNLAHLLGLVCFQRGNNEEAGALLKNAVRLDPNSADAHSNLGLVLLRVGRAEEAYQEFNAALALAPAMEAALVNQGVALLALQRFDEVLESTERALSIYPGLTDARTNRASALRALGRTDEALKVSLEALAGDMHHADAQIGVAATYFELGRLRDAQGAIEAAVAIEPERFEVQSLYGNVLRDLERPLEALAAYEKALAARPEDLSVLSSRIVVLGQLERFDDVLAACEELLALDPRLYDAIFYRGVALQAQGHYRLALAQYEEVIKRDPEYAAAHWNEAWCLLMLGELRAGFEKYEWRWKTPGLNKVIRELGRPLWLGDSSITGKTILLYAEQGFGDTLQYVRYVPLVEALGATVILEVPKPLKPVFAGLVGPDALYENGAELPLFDAQCPLPSLPLAMRTDESSIPARTPYLQSDPERVAKWSRRLGEKTKLRIGVIWSGNQTHKNDRNRSIPLETFLKAFSKRVELVSLQKEVRESDREFLSKGPIVRHFGDSLDDFADTAALIELVDLVVTVDTGVAHLAGAMNKPTWIILDAISDWRWQLERTDSPWYPSVRLYRQAVARQWDEIVLAVARDLAAIEPPKRGLLSLFSKKR